MDRLPEVLLLDILSRLDDSADVARCRIAWKSFNNVYSHLRSINLKCNLRMYFKSRHRVLKSSKRITTSKSIFRNPFLCLKPSSKVTQPYKSIFLDLISNMEVVESVCISLENETKDMWYNYFVAGSMDADDLHFTDDTFVIKWLPRVSKHLKSLSLSSFSTHEFSNVLRLVSLYCHNLVELKVARAWLSMSILNPMPMLTSLTLESIYFNDNNLTTLIKRFPNLQVLKLINISGVKCPIIHLLNLKTCHLSISPFSYAPYSMSVITPRLITLRLESTSCIEVTIEAPVLSHLHLLLVHPNKSLVVKSKNLKTVWINSKLLGTLLDTFHHRSVDKLTLDSSRKWTNHIDFSYVLYNGFRVFPKMSSLCMQPSVWSELEACGKWDIPYRMIKGLKTFSAYLSLVDPSLTFLCVACVLDKCVRLSEVSFLIHRKVSGKVSKRFMSKCMSRWPHLEWRCGSWIEGMEDSWGDQLVRVIGRRSGGMYINPAVIQKKSPICEDGMAKANADHSLTA
ncbi:hypothetical protein CTI12_AA321700 [Artemisia annua]|uniref:F-box domain, Leucine-rich repeat domain, L domain-like protein n=1 Tax=Artemisia annua TaxID=35608 RepID=A0A2U1MZY6_ARTAN|nr:hypothetical protein CTI12_AA321700 [Artemisia annua]